MNNTQVPPSAEGISHSDKQAAENKMASLLMPAVNTLEDVLEDGAPGVKLSAAQFIIRFHYDGKGSGKDRTLEEIFRDITQNEE